MNVSVVYAAAAFVLSTDSRGAAAALLRSSQSLTEAGGGRVQLVE